jgi:RND family efflux transporter MFP subunit
MSRKLILLIITLTFSFNACQEKDPLEVKKTKLKEYKTELKELKGKIAVLEKEIALDDPEFAKENKKAKLITVLPVEYGKFTHYVEISGSVASKKNILISSENMGTVMRILVREGDYVKKGHLVIALDDELLQRNLEQLQVRYELATTKYQRQKNLWSKDIGTELQYLEAKNAKENLERQIANIKTQISKSRVRSPISGTVEKVFVRTGEMANIGTALIRIINHHGMYIEADLSEAFIGKFKKNDPVIIYFPAIDKKITSRLSAIGQVIDENNRTFRVEAILPKTNFVLKPNMLAVVRLKDFEKNPVPIVPTDLIQNDLNGYYVYIIVESNGQKYAKKIHVKRGMNYKNRTYIVEGLKGNELLINQGFRNISDGSKIKIVDKVL